MADQALKKQAISRRQRSKASTKNRYKTRSNISWFANQRILIKAWLKRRPHRSLKRTRRRDYVRPLELPGYVAFTIEVGRLLWNHRRTYAGLVLAYMTAVLLLTSVLSQETYVVLRDTLADTGGQVLSGNIGALSQATLLILALGSGSAVGEVSESQQIISLVLGLYMWLSVVWLLRAQIAGGNPKMRDGLYGSGAPFIPTLLLVTLFSIQMIPGAIGVIGANTLISSGLAAAGLLSFLISMIAALLVMLSLYLIVGTFFSLVVATLPGMYPWRALRTGNDLVVGRRLRLLMRIFWMILIVGAVWFSAMVVFILAANILQSTVSIFESIPIVPFLLVFSSAVALLFSSAYIYILYRKTVDNDAASA